MRFGNRPVGQHGPESTVGAPRRRHRLLMVGLAGVLAAAPLTLIAAASQGAGAASAEAEILGGEAAIEEAERLDASALMDFLPYHAVCADLYRRSGRQAEARIAYDNALRLVETSAERSWLLRQQATVRRN